MVNSEKSGMLGELAAAKYMRRKFYKLTDHNFSSYFGEIDLIFTKGKNIVFVEVKTRDEGSIASPAEFVDVNKQRKLIKTAEYYLMCNKTNLIPRFDVIEVITSKEKIKSVKHLENAFQLG